MGNKVWSQPTPTPRREFLPQRTPVPRSTDDEPDEMEDFLHLASLQGLQQLCLFHELLFQNPQVVNHCLLQLLRATLIRRLGGRSGCISVNFRSRKQGLIWFNDKSTQRQPKRQLTKATPDILWLGRYHFTLTMPVVGRRESSTLRSVVFLVCAARDRTSGDESPPRPTRRLFPGLHDNKEPKKGQQTDRHTKPLKRSITRSEK